MVSLDFSSSVYYNPSAIIFFPLSGVILLGVIVSALFGYRIRLDKKILGMWYVFVILLVAVWVLNISLGHH